MKFIVNVPVCNLRKEPTLHSNHYIKDPLQESQLLYGEVVEVKDIQGEWSYIEAVEQKKFFLSKGWTGYPGWILTSQLMNVPEIPTYNLVITKPWAIFNLLKLSFGTYLKGIKKDEKTWSVQLLDQSWHDIEHSFVAEVTMQNSLSFSLRQKILDHSSLFLNTPYLWGGRSAFFNEPQITSIDCSGLTNLLYRIVGISLPRDAHDQYLKCEKIEFKDLQAADLIFTAPIQNPTRIGHVMLYNQGDQMIEATLDTGSTRLITGKEKLGKPLQAIKTGDQVGEFIVSFGTLSKNE